jgi:hypothetical protein
MTMGAMVRYKRNTGEDVSKMRQDDIEQVTMLLFCMTSAACRREEVEFGLSFDDFADALTPDDFAAAYAAFGAEGATTEDSTKKK